MSAYSITETNTEPLERRKAAICPTVREYIFAIEDPKIGEFRGIYFRVSWIWDEICGIYFRDLEY